VEDFYNSDSSLLSLKQAFQSQTEAESSEIIVMPVMTIGTNNWEKVMAACDEKEVHIKLKKEKIARLTKKVGGAPSSIPCKKLRK